jgi:hypothetical protein
VTAPLADPTFSVRPDAVVALAAELTTLAGELADDAAACRSAATSLSTALSRDEGWAARATATAWAALAEAVADRSSAVADTLVHALAAYAAADAALASRMGPGAAAGPAGGR